MQKVKLFGFPILSSSKADFLRFLDQFLSSSKVAQETTTQLLTIFTPNPEQIVLAQNNQAFANYLEQADYLLPDGVGLLWANKILKFFGKAGSEETISERIPGVAVVEYLLNSPHLQQLKLKTLIVGGRDYPQIEQRDASHLVQVRTNLYWTPAYQDKTHKLEAEEMAVRQIISDLKPDLVFVAFGAPDQEEWLIKHRSLLANNRVKIAMSVGGSFDFYFGKVKRAPEPIQKIGLEWLWRLSRQPWRLRRQLRLLRFIFLVLQKIFKDYSS